MLIHLGAPLVVSVAEGEVIALTLHVGARKLVWQQEQQVRGLGQVNQGEPASLNPWQVGRTHDEKKAQFTENDVDYKAESSSLSLPCFT